MIIKDYGFDDPQKRKETIELFKGIVNDHKNDLKLELTVKALSMTCTLIEKQEQIIEDQEERIAIMEEGCHIDIIRELLAKYGEAKSAKIYEYSGDIDGDLTELDEELAEYRKRAGIEPPKEGEPE